MSANAKKYPLRFNSWTLGGHGADLFEKSAEALELERINPLRGVDEWRLGQIFDDARDGIFADLAWLYNEIEGVEPALLACCDMRESAASECGWLVNTADASRVRGFDQSLADDQRDALLAEFGAIENDVAELAGHLTGAFFRGAAHALPLWNADGSLAGFRHLDLWNFAFDRQTGIWYWNADASRDENTFQPIPPGELVTLASTRHADHAALPIFIRAALGAKRYGVWLDRFGIPPVGVIMPPNAEKGEQGAYMDLARKFARGGSGILPNGSSVVYGTEARAVCPFIDFIRFQQQQIYLVGIGRVQSGETDGANLGGNAAGVVEDGFRRLVRRDARRIARAINDSVTRKVLARLFPGKPALAQFAWDTEAKRTAHEVLEDAGLAKSAGLAIDIGQLSELTGYTLEKAPETPQPGLFGGLNSDRTPPPSLQTAKSALQNAPKKPDAQGEGQDPAALLGPFLRALQGDCKLIADEVEELLKDPTPEKARALLDKIPDLVPEDPALAPLLAEVMAKAYGEAFTQGSGAQPPVVVENSQCRAADPAHCPTHGTPREPETKPHHDRYGSTDESTLASDSQKNFKRGANALEAMERMQGGYIDKAMYREETGWIRFDWGTKGDPDSKPVTFAHGHGISHILAKHGAEAKKLPDVIARGEAKLDPKDPRAIILVTDTAYAVVVPLMQGQRRIITMYEPEPDSKKLAAIKNYPPAPKLQGKKGG